MFVDASTFLLIIAAGAFISWLACYFWLKEPEGGFGDEYVISSVDQAIADEARHKREAQAKLALVFSGSDKVALADRGDGVELTARFRSVDDIKSLVERLERQGMVPKA